jgi:hypothetical protein
MKINAHFVWIVTCYLLSTVLLGCTTVKEVAKGLVGVSTQVLEDKRKDALKKSFAIDYNSCYIKVKDILKTEDTLKDESKDKIQTKPYIYAEDTKKRMLAIYLSETDTTPVGIFFTEEAAGRTLVEVSSPSIYAKEFIANKIFTGMEEKEPNVKQEINN